MNNSSSEVEQNKLIVILHGYNGSKRRMSHIEKHVKEFYIDSTVLIPALPLNLLSTANPDEIAKSIVNLIDVTWQNGNGRYTGIVLIGHSYGALIARKAYVYACGENEDARFDYQNQTLTNPKSWAGEVERIILFAGTNRGWSINPDLSITADLKLRLGIAFGNLLMLFNYIPTIFLVRKGAPFITQLRLQWLSLQQHAHEKGIGNVIIIQLLGTIDDLVSPEDNLDLVTGSSFYYLEMPYSSHDTVILLDESVVGKARAKVFVDALSLNKEALESLQTHSIEQQILQQNPKVTDVVFVIHGIRDAGFWTKKIARRIQILGHAKGRVFETETSSYGYFPLLSFLLFSNRRTKVEWLMDQYTENKARFPNAKFSFVGHSHGTYLLARALKEYPSCKFENIVFGGSVVRTDYNWKQLIDDARVSNVLNYVASKDYTVAIVPKTFQTLGIQDLGSGGHDGFIAPVQQIHYLKGNHSAAVQENIWDHIAEFVVNGNVATLDTPYQQPEQKWLTKIAGWLGPLLITVFVGLAIFIGSVIWCLPYSNDIVKTCLFIFYLAAVWWILTKF